MYENKLSLLPSVKISRSRLDNSRVKSAFDEICKSKKADEVECIVRKVSKVGAKTYRWSLLIASRDTAPAWAPKSDLNEHSLIYVFVVESSGFVGVSSSGAGEVLGALQISQLDYLTTSSAKASVDSSFQNLKLKANRASSSGVRTRVLSGNALEKATSRTIARQSVLSGFRVETNDSTWTVSALSGRISEQSKRLSRADFCKWFCALVDSIPATPSIAGTFVNDFSRPVELSTLPVSVQPSMLQLDSSFLTDDDWANLTFEGAEPSKDDQNWFRAIFQVTWSLVPVPKKAEWDVVFNGCVLGRLRQLKGDYSLRSSLLHKFAVKDPIGATVTTINKLMTEDSQSKSIFFNDAAYVYSAGQLFFDSGIVATSEHLVAILDGTLPSSNLEEKKLNASQSGFDSNSLFGFTEKVLAAGDDWVVLDDLSSEWADVISVNDSKKLISFFHCKAGDSTTGASQLHEVVSQATKNLGYVSANRDEIMHRLNEKWINKWSRTSIGRILKSPLGVPLNYFVDSFERASLCPVSKPIVALVVSNLSKSSLEKEFLDMRNGVSVRDHIPQVLWLLTMFSESCRLIGAEPRVVCHA